jgi:preprotein translocase subunit SecA
VSKAIQSAQTQVEQQNFEIRKNVLKYDEVLNKQRTVIYDERRQVLQGADLSDQIRSMIDDVVKSYVEGATATGYAEEWDLEQLWTALKTLYPVSLSVEEAIEQAGGSKSDLTFDYLLEELTADAQSAYDVREEELGAEVLRELERRVVLSVLDRKWREHLYEMDYLQEGIGLRAMAQRDPLVEYQREGFDMFTAMMDAIKEESVGFLFNLEVQVEEPAEAAPPPPPPTLREAPVGAPARVAEPSVPARTAPPKVDQRVLREAQHAQEHGENGHPHVSAKGLDRTAPARPLVYSSPELGSETPNIQRGTEASGDGATAPRRQPSRSNPNRGSRGNRSKKKR